MEEEESAVVVLRVVGTEVVLEGVLAVLLGDDEEDGVGDTDSEVVEAETDAAEEDEVGGVDSEDVEAEDEDSVEVGSTVEEAEDWAEVAVGVGSAVEVDCCDSGGLEEDPVKVGSTVEEVEFGSTEEDVGDAEEVGGEEVELEIGIDDVVEGSTDEEVGEGSVDEEVGGGPVDDEEALDSSED